MAEKDKVIKSGQLTLPRILFLAAIGVLIVGMVAVGGKVLIIGYWVLTLAICLLLYLIATDYGVHMEEVHLVSPQPQAPVEAAPAAGAAPIAASGEARVKRRTTTRPVKRRR